MENQEEILEEVAEEVAEEVEAEVAEAAEEEVDDDTPMIMPGPLGKFFTFFFGFK